MKPLLYRFPGAVWNLEVTVGVVAFLKSQAQLGLFARESVGQLYARDLTGPRVAIDAVTKLRPRWAFYSRLSFSPREAARERMKQFNQGFHCIGLWHSHPQAIPIPSHEDVALAADFARAAHVQLNGILFIIVGNVCFPEGLGVWLHDGLNLMQAAPDAMAGQRE